jgi:hypothetical protein
MHLHLRLVERPAKPRGVSLGAALAFGLHFQPSPACGRLHQCRADWASPWRRSSSPAARCSHSRLITASSVSTVVSRSAHGSVSFVVSYIHVQRGRSGMTASR